MIPIDILADEIMNLNNVASISSLSQTKKNQKGEINKKVAKAMGLLGHWTQIDGTVLVGKNGVDWRPCIL